MTDNDDTTGQFQPDDEYAGQYRLVMPFVCVQSAGGPYEDAAFAAGMQMGALDQELRSLAPLDALPRSRYVPTPLVHQADLIAMKHGYITEATPWEDHPDEWTRLDFGFASREEDSDG